MDPIQKRLNSIDNETIPHLLQVLSISCCLIAALLIFHFSNDLLVNANGKILSLQVDCNERGFRCYTTVGLDSGEQIIINGRVEGESGSDFVKELGSLDYRVNENTYTYAEVTFLPFVLVFVGFVLWRFKNNYKYKPE